MVENKLNCDPEFVMAYLNNGFRVATLLIWRKNARNRQWKKVMGGGEAFVGEALVIGQIVIR